MKTETKEFNSLDFIMEWETGDMNIHEEAEGFQHLIDSGMAWKLQGCYGRRAAELIKAGYCNGAKNIK